MFRNLRNIWKYYAKPKIRLNNTPNVLNGIVIPKNFHQNNFVRCIEAPQRYPQRVKQISNINELIDHIQKENRIYLNNIEKFLDEINFDNLSEDQIILLLECCGKCVPNETLESRDKICQQIFERLLEKNNFTHNIYSIYIKICTENNVLLNHKEFLASMVLEPNKTIYKALLANVAEAGDTKQAKAILNLMKTKDIPLDEDVFNLLVLAHSIKEGLPGAKSIMEAMEAASLQISGNTKYALFKGLAIRNENDDFLEALKAYDIDMDETQYLKVLEKIGLSENRVLLPKFINLFDRNVMTRDFISKIDYLCIHLINMGYPHQAMEIYESFVEPKIEKRYAHFLLKEMLLCQTPIQTVIDLAKHIAQSNLNPHSLESITDVALRLRDSDDVLEFFKHLPHLRPHFFWPLIINAGKKDGERGVLEILEIMSELNVKADDETFQIYVLPYFNIEQPQLIIKMLQKYDYSVKDLINPLLAILLEFKYLDKTHELCCKYDIKIEVGKLLKLLALNINKIDDIPKIVHILQKIWESNPTYNDLIGEFLIKSVTNNKNLRLLLALIKEISSKKLLINTNSADILIQIMSRKCKNQAFLSTICEQIESLQDFTMKKETPAFLPHPRDMNLEELECHLIELKSKSLDTRGVLRKLIQSHARLGNLKRVEELRDEFQKNNYLESNGMKSSLMHCYTQGGHLEAALNLYEELKNGNFNLDAFKIIDLAQLMVQKGMYDEAFNVISEGVKVKGQIITKSIERNCKVLLDSFGDNETEQNKMFRLLLEQGYCCPTNVILGTIVRLQLNKKNYEKAVELYEEFAKNYRCTPLQLELLIALIGIKDIPLMERILEITERIHGKSGMQIALISALAEQNQSKPLRTFLTENFVSNNLLKKRCERWVYENKIDALECLAEAAEKLSHIDVQMIYQTIIKYYYLNNDCEGALIFYERLLDKDEMAARGVQKDVMTLLENCKYEIPAILKT